MQPHNQVTDPRDGQTDAEYEPVFEADFAMTMHRVPILLPPVPPNE